VLNKLHLYVQAALALNGLEAGGSCFDEFLRRTALRRLADGSRSAKTAVAFNANLSTKMTP